MGDSGGTKSPIIMAAKDSRMIRVLVLLEKEIAGYGVRKNSQLTDLPVHASYKIAKRLYAKGRDADGIFIACPRWPTITDVQVLEDEIGKPVITSSRGSIVPSRQPQAL